MGERMGGRMGGLVCLILAVALPPQLVFALDGGELKPVNAFQSSKWGFKLYEPADCIDGNALTLCRTQSERAPWFAIDYGVPVTIERVELFTFGNVWGQLNRNIEVRISNELPASGSQMFSGGTVLNRFSGPAGQLAPAGQQNITILGQETSGKYVIVQMNIGEKRRYALDLREVKAFGLSPLTECIEEDGIDYYGNDIPHNAKKTGNQEECAAYAASIPGGLFWTWNKGNKHCHVKNSNSGKRKHGYAVSGSVHCATSTLKKAVYKPGCAVVEGAFINGGRGRQLTEVEALKSDGWLDCRKRCRNNPKCKAWTMRVDKNQCWLMTTLMDTTANPNWEWGLPC